MVFSSTVFLFLFLPIVVLIYFNPIVKNRTFKNIFLLLASLSFYAWGEPVFVFLMMFSILVTWILGLHLNGLHRKTVLFVGIGYHVSVLFLFKYFAFFVEQIGFLLNRNFSNSIRISLPIGISFFTFQMMSYLFDIYYGKADAQKNPLYVGLYVALFPQLIAGPIVRYQDIADQIINRTESADKFCSGMQRFSIGLGKKVLISDYMAQLTDMSFHSINNMSVLSAWLGAIAYTFQIYFDFSGYSDMAIGLGKMFGFEFNENFNYPYISKNITDFWRRWHISLSTWFRDYVYIPLGGNRVSKMRWIFNLFLVWLLTGIWHGANWTFLVWGLIYFVFLLIEKLTNFDRHIGILKYVYTAIVVIFAWVIFRADTLEMGLSYLSNMIGIGANGFIDAIFVNKLSGAAVVLFAACVGATPLFKNIFLKLKNKRFGWIEPVFTLLVFILSIMQAISSTYSPFIYFNF